MSRSVIARQKGDDYQARFFWHKACRMYMPPTCVKCVSWELDGTFGFDDVVVHYEPASVEAGRPVYHEYFQVKFHVDHNRGFTCENLMDPTFIGNQTESLLQRLHKNYTADSTKFENSRYYIINTWGIDHADTLKNLLDNTGGFNIKRLRQGGEKSVIGKIRKNWREHLELESDEELFRVLAPLRIKFNYDDENRLKENLNIALTAARLKVIPDNQQSCKYTDLIQKLHASGKNTFTKEELFTILQAEDLVAMDVPVVEDSFKVGIRSFTRGAETLETEVDRIACFLHCYTGRFILEEYSDMQYIRSKIESLAQAIIAEKRKVVINLDTHISLAFLVGYHLDIKYGGADISIVQKTPVGKLIWRPDLETINQNAGTFWNISMKEHNSLGNDIALSIDITRDTKWDVENHIAKHLSGVRYHYQATILPQPGSGSIQDANHAVAAIDELIGNVVRLKKENGLNGQVYIFLAGPNSVAFFLGQRSRILKNLTIYEFDFEQDGDGGYHSILTI